MVSTDVPPYYGIGALPTELLHLILSHLEIIRVPRPDRASEVDRQTHNSQIQKALHSLTLICRRFAAITTPYLYRTVIHSPHNPHAALSLLLTLCEQPKLAQNIEYIEYSFRKNKPLGPNDCYSQDQLDWIQDVIARAKWTVAGVDQMYYRNKVRGHFDAWEFTEADGESTQYWLWNMIWQARDKNQHLFALMAIMMLAANLTEIAAPRTRALGILAFKTTLFNTGLQRLCFFGDPRRQNHIVVRKNSLPEQAHALETFLLRHLHLSYFDPNQRARFAEVHLDDLSLDVFDTGMDAVVDDIKLCTSLRSLSCRWREFESRRPNPPPSPQDLSLPLLGEALRSFEHSLQRLTIDTLECAWLVDMESDIPPLGSLRSFTVLKHLDVSGLVLFGDYITAVRPDVALSSILPISLESLNVKIEWDDEIEEVLYAYLSDCALFQPALKSIECSWRPAPKTIAEHLIYSYEEIGVKLTLAIAST